MGGLIPNLITAFETAIKSHQVVAVAQLVEHRIVIPVVAGSSPVGHPNFGFYGSSDQSRFSVRCLMWIRGGERVLSVRLPPPQVPLRCA